MKITFIGAAHEVTGSCTLVEACGKRIMVDCGLEQGPDIYENCDIPVAPGNIDAILLTHAHIDHSGKLPVMVANGFTGEIHTTRATGRLCDIMLRDSAHIQESEAEWRNRRAERSGAAPYKPLYTMADAQETIGHLALHEYGETIMLFEGISISFMDAGHLFGSAHILLTIEEAGKTRTLLFSGDVGNPGKPLLRSPARPPKVDVAVVESTYGDRVHSQEKSDYVGQLAEAIESTLLGRGNLVIPAFAVGRTQELLYLLRVIKERKLVRFDFPVYLDSPLAIEATHVFSADMEPFFDEEASELIRRGVNPISFPGLHLAVSAEESKAINDDPVPKVIISASGMCEAGRIRHHLKHNLWRKDSTILFSGYQSEGTVGRKLLNGAKSVKLFGEDISVRARIAQIDSFSSHADQRGLLDWVRGASPELLFVNHGEDETCDHFAALAQQETGCRAIAPFSADEYDLVSGECLYSAGPVRKQKSKRAEEGKEKRRDEKNVYGQLLEAGRALMDLIDSCAGWSNRETERLTQEIRQLIEAHRR